MERCYVTLVVDRSGSMGVQRDEVIESVNTFKHQLKEKVDRDKDVRLTLILFDHEYEEIYRHTPLDEVPDLTHENYVPRGATALLDATHRAIMTAEEDRKEYTLGPTSVVIAVMTDGQENNSKEIKDPKAIKKLIDDREDDDDWTIAFLGSDISTWGESRGMGISGSNVVHMGTKNVKGTMDAFAGSVGAYLNSDGLQKRALKSNLVMSNAEEYQNAGSTVDKEGLEKFKNIVTPSQTDGEDPNTVKPSETNKDNS